MSEATASSGFGPGAGLLGMLSDDRLARRAVDGDERAFATIFGRYHQRLYRFCLAIVGDPQDAQDALQNTMVKVLGALPGEERRIELKPWLYRIAHNESIDLLRRRREARELDPELPSRGPSLAEEAAARERLRLLFADLEELPERQRETLVMRELAGLGFAEIGDALGTSAAVARQTVYEARLGLRQMDEGREMDCEAVTRALSDGDSRVARRRDLRAHLRSCAHCRGFRDEIEGRRKDFAALSPLPAVAAAGLLHGLLGSAGGSAGGGGLAAALGGGTAKSVGASAALKGVATVAVVAAVGVTAADRGGLVDTPLPGGDGSPRATRTQEPGAGSGGQSSGASGTSGAASEAGVRPANAAGTDGAAPAATAGARKAAAKEDGGAGTTAAGGPAGGTQTSSHGNGNGGEHPHGRGHEKRHPAASAHGQQTAAAHKGAEHGSAGATGPSTQPVKPPHPAHPSNPGAEKGASASPPAGGAKAPAETGEQTAPPAQPPAEAEEGASGNGKGKGTKP